MLGMVEGLNEGYKDVNTISPSILSQQSNNFEALKQLINIGNYDLFESIVKCRFNMP